MPLAVVTGAGIRVGRACALALAADGHDVVVHAHRSMDKAQETVALIEGMGRRAFLEQADLADDDAVDAFGQRLNALADAHAGGAIDVLVHSAGIFEEVPFSQITRERYRRMQRINVEAPFFLTAAVLPALERAGAPVVIHVVDVTAHRPMNRYAHYTVSKAGLYGLTKALTIELGPKVRVCGVSPGIVAFPADFPEELREKILRRIPLRREGNVDDVGRAVVFLARAPYMNGVVIPIDGGWEVTL